ncbi:hypothetical protein BH20ACT8_BH20ACT8_00440 [soil metagenome]
MTTFAGRYRLEELLGTGGMSRVHAAHDELLDRRVAVKLLRGELASDPIVRQRMLREARAAASLSHPNAVGVFDVGEDDGTPFLVMEYVDGRTLTDLLRERGPLPVAEAVAIADAVLAALQAAHERGLVHRDVKPSNILLPADGSEAKLADFGIAKGIQEAASGLTITGTVIGTPRYLAPEQAAGERATAATDLYAVGILVYELLSGAPPFNEGSAVAIAVAHQRVAAPPLADAAPGVPPALAAVVHRALEKAPGDRYASAGDMRAALADHAAQPPVLSPALTPAGEVPGGGTLVMGAPAAFAASHGADEADDGEPAVLTVGRGRGAGSGALWAFVVAAVLGLIAFGAFAAAQSGGEPGPATADPSPAAGAPTPSATLSPVASATTRPTPTPTPEPTPTPPPTEVATRLAQTPEEFAAALAEDPDGYGTAGDDILSELEEFIEDGQRRGDARDLIKDVREAVDDGEFAQDAGALLIGILEPLAAEPDSDDEDDDDDRGRGQGRGRGEGGD